MYFYCSTPTAQKMKFSIKDFFSKYVKICSFLCIWSHLLNNKNTKKKYIQKIHTTINDPFTSDQKEILLGKVIFTKKLENKFS